MVYRIKQIAKCILGTDRVGRNFRIFPDDTLLVSYPRSGNLWIRFLVANLLHPDLEVRFSNIEQLVPDTCNASTRALNGTPRPRFIKSHHYFDHRYRKIVYIVRDPRDIVLSYHQFQRKYRQIPDDFPLEQYVDRFIAGKLGSEGWGSWEENVASWVTTRGRDPNFLLLRYEDLIADTIGGVACLADFLGIQANAAQLHKAIELSSAQKLRPLEKQDAHVWVSTRNRRQDIPMVGVATSGGWRQRLPPTSVSKIEEAWGDLMVKLGYDLVTRNLSGHETSPATGRTLQPS
jgi:hypothetical protein